MVDITLIETCKEKGFGKKWYGFNDEVLYAEDITEAREILKNRLEGIYNIKRRKMIYQDTKSKGTLHVGYIYSGMEDNQFLQVWCSFYDHKTRLPINPKTGEKYYAEVEA